MSSVIFSVVVLAEFVFVIIRQRMTIRHLKNRLKVLEECERVMEKQEREIKRLRNKCMSQSAQIKCMEAILEEKEREMLHKQQA